MTATQADAEETNIYAAAVAAFLGGHHVFASLWTSEKKPGAAVTWLR